MKGARIFDCALMMAACDGAPSSPGARPPEPAAKPEPVVGKDATLPASDRPVAPRADEREAMVDDQLLGRDITDGRVLEAMRRVPRHEFVPADFQREAYEDHALPIGYDVTISQPYIVALMTELARVEPGDRVLDVGTGSGYQAAVLAEMGAEVWGIEIIEPLAEIAAARLDRLGYDRAQVRAGDGYAGWPEHAPFDAIIIAAAAPKIPEPLREQLAVGGRLVVPVGTHAMMQALTVVTRTSTGYETEQVTAVAFVPMTGRVRDPP